MTLVGGAGAGAPNKNPWRHDDNRLGANRQILAEPFSRAAPSGFLLVTAPSTGHAENQTASKPRESHKI
jgi:hypothetical protein